MMKQYACFKNLKKYLDGLVEEGHVPGLDCVVSKNHEILFRYYTGFRDLENKKPMTGEEQFIIFSMTKMLTCVCALQLFEKGYYRMNDPVYKYLPEFRKMKIKDEGYAKNPITIRNLFTMTAGLDYDLRSPGILKALNKGETSTRELVAAMAEKELCFEPGSGYCYSLCHDVLGALIEVWSGMRYGEYMRKYILQPLGMNHTFFCVPEKYESIDNMMARYTFNEKGLPERLPLECVYVLSDNYESGGAGLVSTTEDYAVFLDALASGGIAKNGNRILQPSTVQLMSTNHLSGHALEMFDQMRKGYGYGLGVRTHLDPERSGSLSPVGEFGWDGAAGAFSMVDVQNGISLTFFQQIHNWKIEIQNEMRNALYSDLKQW